MPHDTPLWLLEQTARTLGRIRSTCLDGADLGDSAQVIASALLEAATAIAGRRDDECAPSVCAVAVGGLHDPWFDTRLPRPTAAAIARRAGGRDGPISIIAADHAHTGRNHTANNAAGAASAGRRDMHAVARDEHAAGGARRADDEAELGRVLLLAAHDAGSAHDRHATASARKATDNTVNHRGGEPAADGDATNPSGKPTYNATSDEQAVGTDREQRVRVQARPLSLDTAWSHVSPVGKAGAMLAVRFSGGRVRAEDVEVLEMLVRHAGIAVADGPMPAALRRADLLDALGPAQRRLVPRLLTDDTEQDIADSIHRSRHTVHDHVKIVYAAWGVNSRSALCDVWFGRRSAPIQAGGVDFHAPRRRAVRRGPPDREA